MNVDRDWVKQQIGKGISAEQALLKTEKEHRERIKNHEVSSVYDRIIAQDEKHVQGLQQVAEKYGLEAKGTMEAGGGILGGIKSRVEDIATADPFQTIGNDLMMKSNALNYDLAWVSIFRNIGDLESAQALEVAAQEDEEHQMLMRQTLTEVGIREASGEKIEE